MATSKKPPVYFVDGFAARDELVGIPAYLHSLVEDDVEFTRFYTHNRTLGKWWQLEYPHEVVSTAFTTDKVWHLLSKRGVLIQLSGGSVRTLAIPRADTGPGGLGYVTQVKVIGGRLYICGFRRQVYRLDGSTFSLLSESILSREQERGFGFESIDGTAPDDIYAVGRQGEMFHFNGRSWRQLPGPTNRDLNRVRCVSRDLVYACGDSGVFLRGAQDNWDDLSEPGFQEHLWGLEVFKDTPYVAHLKGLRMFDGRALVPVSTGLKPEIDGYRLHASAGILWSFGQEQIAGFDGKKWFRVVCPDNA